MGVGRRGLMQAALALLAGCDGCWEEEGPSPATTATVGARSDKVEGDVLVVGAGMSGLAAAAELGRAGASVIVLEGRDRIGGRIWTNRELEVPFDMGASWIHGTRGNPIAKLAKEHRVKTVETDYTSIHLYDHEGSELKDSSVGEIFSAWGEVEAGMAALAEELEEDISVEAAVMKVLEEEELDADEQLAAEWMLATQAVAAGVDLSQLSLAGDESEGLAGGDEAFPLGYDQIARAVGRDVDVRRSQIVRRIEHDDRGVRVRTDAETYRADHVVVTLPLGVLAAGKVTIAPGLTAAHQKALSQVKMGVLNKVAMVFDEAFWPTDRDFLGYISKTPGEFPVFLNGAKLGSDKALMAFVGGSAARELEQQSFDSIKARIGAILTTMFGSKAKPPRALQFSRWASDPFSLGSYSHVPVGGTSKAYAALAEPIGRVHFAGEHTSSDHPGTVHGAFLSGIRAAKELA